MDAALDEHFVRTVIDLAETTVTSNRSRYELTKVAALLRSLLLDRNRLSDAANRGRNLRLVFEVNQLLVPRLAAGDYPEGLPLPRLMVDMEAIDPQNFPDLRRTNLTLKKFLTLPIIYFTGSTFSVRDAIDFCANSVGGVHYDTQPKTQTHVDLRKVMEELSINDVEAPVRSMLGIARVTVTALRPLVTQVMQDHGWEV